MPMSPNDTERLLKAINQNTAAILAAAAAGYAHRKPDSIVPTEPAKTQVITLFDEYLKKIE